MNRDLKFIEGVQRRAIVATELRAVGDEFALVGYGAIFNSLSKNLGGFFEQIKPGAFSRSIREGADVKCLFNHAPDNILGRTKSGTLKVIEDSRGLRFHCQLNRASQYHRDVYESVKRGDITECSFAFTVPKGGDSWSTGTDPETKGPCDIRTLLDVDLVDVSVVTYPAYDGTQADARKAGYGAKRTVDSSDLQERVKRVRRAAQIIARELRLFLQQRRDTFSQEDFASLEGHFQFAHELAECACAIHGTARDIIAGRDRKDSDFDTEDFNEMDEASRNAHAVLDLAAQRCAQTRLAHAKIAGVLGRKRK